MSFETVTHGQLCQRAVRWLKTAAVYPDASYRSGHAQAKCAVVLSELMCTSYEIPDAIGWALGGRLSILVECKTSRSDFRADQNKTFRRIPKLGMGRHRYYFAPAGVITLDDVPSDWGLLEYLETGRVSVVKLAPEHRERHVMNEMAMMWSALRRIKGMESALQLSGWLPSLEEQEEHF